MKLMTKNNNDDDANPYLAPAGAGAATEPQSDSRFFRSGLLTFGDWIELLQTGLLVAFAFGPFVALIGYFVAHFVHPLLIVFVLLLYVSLVSVIVARDYAACRSKRIHENQMLHRMQKSKPHLETNS